VYEHAEQLLGVNVAQAAQATAQAASWDRIATGIGLAVALLLLVTTAILIIAADRAVYRPLLGLTDAIRRYASSDYTARAQERGAAEIQAISRAFNEMAEELQRHRAQQLTFVASVAHDLRNPLSAMKAAIQTISLRNDKARSETPALTGLISRQIDLLARMLWDLLDSARIESGQVQLVTEDHDVRDLVLDSVALFRQLAPHHQIVAQVPETKLMLTCDSARVTQVINNLLSNAIKYSGQGGRIEASAREHAGGVLIEISDEGIGIHAEESALIFEPFRRSGTLSGAIPGVGIGLSVTRRIVETHGGRISVQSVVGVGSTFSVWLPRRPPFAERAYPSVVSDSVAFDRG